MVERSGSSEGLRPSSIACFLLHTVSFGSTVCLSNTKGERIDANTARQSSDGGRRVSPQIPVRRENYRVFESRIASTSNELPKPIEINKSVC